MGCGIHGVAPPTAAVRQSGAGQASRRDDALEIGQVFREIMQARAAIDEQIELAAADRAGDRHLALYLISAGVARLEAEALRAAERYRAQVARLQHSRHHF